MTAGQEPRDAFSVPLNADLLIEASAGTGKTYALTTLTARLIVEERRAIDDLLIVTFTVSAAGELRTRVRRTLQAARRAVAEPDRAGDSQARQLWQHWRRLGICESDSRHRLRAAVRDFDRANITTIHGFGQRTLLEFALHAGTAFTFGVSGDDVLAVGGGTRDFWRRRMTGQPVPLLEYAKSEHFVPGEDTTGWVGGHHAKQQDIRSVSSPEDFDEELRSRKGAWLEALDEVQDTWADPAQQAAFLEVANPKRWTKGNRNGVAGRARTIRGALEAGTLQEMRPNLVLAFGTTALGEGLYKKHAEALGLSGRSGPGANPVSLFRVFENAGKLGAEYGGFWLANQRRHVLQDVGKTLHHGSWVDRQLGFDALLVELHRALAGKRGAELARRIRSRYPVALIDEFQDTDRLQAEIFNRIYGGHDKREAEPTLPAGVTTGATADSTLFDSAGAGADDRADLLVGARHGVEVAVGDEPDAPVPHVRQSAADDHAHPGSTRTADAAPPSSPSSRSPENGRLFVVGDPKQSIYRFRGADVFAYLEAQKRLCATSRPLTLKDNYRSTPGLVRAVNELFDRPTPFVLPDFDFPAAAAAKRRRASLVVDDQDDDPAPFQFVLIPKPQARRQYKSELTQLAAVQCAGEIARLVALGTQGRAMLRGHDTNKRLKGGDMAVLVRKGAQGQEVAEALKELGVDSVELGTDNIFDTAEAGALYRLLRALCLDGAEYNATALLRGALAADLFGLHMKELAELRDDDDVWDHWRGLAREWSRIWRERGIASLMRRILFAGEPGCSANLLRYPNGTRRLTNYLHLADLLHEAETRHRPSRRGLLGWFRQSRAESRPGEETAQLRLESDENLVKIVTVHRAKGLEFPIVFYPFAWDGRRPPSGKGRRPTADYYDPGCKTPVLDLRPSDEAYARERVEEHADELRLLYVALTRAQYRCVVTWAQSGQAEYAPMAWLLHGYRDPSEKKGEHDEHEPDAQPAASGKREEAPSSNAADAPPSSEAGPRPSSEPVPPSTPSSPSSQGTLEVGQPGEAAAPDETAVGADEDAGLRAEGAEALDRHARYVKGLNTDAWRLEVERFQADETISVRPIETEPPPTPASDNAHDADSLQARTFQGELARVRQRTSYTALSTVLPTAVAGTADGHRADDRDEVELPDHDQAPEIEDAEAPSAPSAEEAETILAFPGGGRTGSCLHEIFERHLGDPDAADLEQVCRAVLPRYGFQAKWLPAAFTLVRNALDTPLAQPGEAGGVFRLSDLKRPITEMEFHLPVDRLTRTDLGRCLQEHGYDHLLPDHDDEINGFLHGFIDLAARHDGRWYVLDYKSTWLGPDLASYAEAEIGRAMSRHGYHLQYLLYLTALHRLLRLRLPEYDYDRDIGGAFYLFLRGMRPNVPGSGVFRHRPSRGCIEAIDACFGDAP